MKFGVREICDVVFKAKSAVTVGGQTFVAGQPVLYIDTAKTSTLEGAATTVYATGGRGNSRLIAWEGEKTLTFTVEDALLSPMSFAMLSGAGLLTAGAGADAINVHATVDVVAVDATSVTVTGEDLGIVAGESVVFYQGTDAATYGTALTDSGAIAAYLGTGTISASGLTDATGSVKVSFSGTSLTAGDVVRVDLYLTKTASTTQELQIDVENFAGYYYVEASTLFRDEETGEDFPAEIIIPKAKIQSNFTFTMAATGDPSTFTFTMDAFPAPTYFSGAKKVLATIQIVGDGLTEG